MGYTILITEEPTSCETCLLCNGEKGVCVKTGKDISIDNRPYDCPLIPLPEPKMYNQYNFESYSNGVLKGYNMLLEELTKSLRKEKEKKDEKKDKI